MPFFSFSFSFSFSLFFFFSHSRAFSFLGWNGRVRLRNEQTLTNPERIHTLSHPPPPPFLAALKAFKAAQASTESALRDREGLATRTLELYERAGEKGMRDVARRARFLRAEIERTVGEVRGLEEGGSE